MVVDRPDKEQVIFYRDPNLDLQVDEGEGGGEGSGVHVQGHTELSSMPDLQALWRSVSVDGMTETDISAYLQNGGCGQH